MINRVILMGRLTADPTFSQTASGISACKFAVAVDSGYKNKDGEKQTDFINCVAWRNTAEFINKYFAKGNMIIIEGKIKNNNYDDKNGAKHYSYNVQVDNATFGESKAQKSSPVINSEKPEDLKIDNLSGFDEIIGGEDVPF